MSFMKKCPYWGLTPRKEAPRKEESALRKAMSTLSKAMILFCFIIAKIILTIIALAEKRNLKENQDLLWNKK